jgi:gliding motility-associated-like protein
MITVIDPEMPRQITTWGGTYVGWQSNVTDLRNFILARCDSMNSGFIDCDTAITDIFDVTVEIIGVGEVEMSNGNFINNLNTPWTDQRFGGINLPFEVKSGSFDHWEIISSTPYVYDPNVDTLVLDLQSDVTVKAYFGESKGIVFDVSPSGTTTSININGAVVNIFPHSTPLMVDENITLTPTIDPLYAFDSWSSDSNALSPNALTETISFTVAYSDTIKLHLYQKPTIVYDIVPAGTTTSIDINGVNIAVFPYSETVFIDDLNTLSPNIDPNYSSGSWSSNYNPLLNGNTINNSFYGIYSDTLTLTLSTVSAFIAGNDSVCENAKNGAKVSVYFTGFSPFTFNLSIDGISQPPITTTINPYIINTTVGGNYALVSYNDANEFGTVSGQAMVTMLSSPIAQFNAQPDSMTILYTTTQLVDKSVGDIVSWQWDFGDNTIQDFTSSPYHTYKDSLGIYQISLIVMDDNGCSDTTFRQLWIADEYWMYIPNSFTPDLDGVNDVFCLIHHGVREETFYFNIYDRFSNLVYATENIADLECFLNSNGWDGKHDKTGNDLPMGTYIYEVYFQDFEGWKHQDRGHIFIVR